MSINLSFIKSITGMRILLFLTCAFALALVSCKCDLVEEFECFVENVVVSHHEFNTDNWREVNNEYEEYKSEIVRQYNSLDVNKRQKLSKLIVTYKQIYDYRNLNQ